MMFPDPLRCAAVPAMIALASGAPAFAQWQVRAPLPEARSRAAGALIGSTFYVMGGESSAGRDVTCWKYDIITDVWTPIASMPGNGSGLGGVSNCDAAAIGTDIYLPGGYNGAAGTTTLLKYDTVGNAWSIITTDPVPVPVYAHAVVSDGTFLYVTAGTTEAFYRFDPAGDPGLRWTTLAPMPSLHPFPGACFISGGGGGGRIHIVANGGDPAPSLHDVFDIAAGTWSSSAGLSVERGGPGLFDLSGEPYVVGGGWVSYLATGQVFNGSSWNNGAAANRGVRTFAYDGNENYLVKAGGWRGSYDATTEVFVNSTLPAACCMTDGTCAEVSPSACVAAGGTFQGVGSVCAGVACLQRGACCFRNGTCTAVIQPACASQGGTWTAEGVTCEDAACPQPGACCLSDGDSADSKSCILVQAPQCAAAGGVFQGPGTSCASGSCFQGTVLWHNGPVGTGPTSVSGVSAPAGTQWSELQADNPVYSNTSLGATVNAGNVRIADDFTIAAPGGWHIDDIVVMCYLAGSSPSISPFTAGVLRIWDGPPNDAASSVVWGDTTTNRLVQSTFTGMYRTPSTATPAPGTPPNHIRPIYANRLAVGTTLPAGTYWIEYATVAANNPATAHFSPAITPQGIRTPVNANALQFAISTGQWREAVDEGNPASSPDVPLDQSFIIHGEAIGGPPCYANCDASTAIPVLNVADFTCFLQRFASADLYANCDGSTSPPVLNVADFTCFLQAFAAGCP